MTKAQYMGPGTNLDARLARGDEGITPADKASKRHDLRYALAHNIGDIRRADVQMLKEVADSNDTTFNKSLANVGIGGKIALESGGFAKPEDFTTFGGLNDVVKRAKYEAALKQAGGSKAPSHRLKMKLIANMRRQKKKEYEGSGVVTDLMESLSSKGSKMLLPFLVKYFKSGFKAHKRA
jgi:hypothetical protein